MKKIYPFIIISITSILINACGGATGGNPPPSGFGVITAKSEISPGETCPYGGTRVVTGLDTNRDGVLQEAEETSSEIICSNTAESFGGLVFLADKNTNDVYELFRVYSDGSALTKIDHLDTNLGDVDSFEVSPDKKRVAYTKGKITQRQLYIASLVSEAAPVLIGGQPDGSNVRNPQWAPDGSRLSFVADHDTDNVTELYTVLPDGTGKIKVSGISMAGGVFLAFWAPNGSRLVYQASQDTYGVPELYTVMPDGTNNTKVSGAMVTGGGVSSFSWAPDSSRLAYMADQDTNDVHELYTVLPDGTSVVKINGFITDGAYVKKEVLSYQWAPDSSRLAYRADQDTDNVFELYTALPDGTDNIKVSGVMRPGGDVWHYAWAPDSSRLGYMASHDKSDVELYTVLPNDTVRTKVNTAIVDGGDVRYFQWSPDSTRLAYTADLETINVIGLYTASPDGENELKINGETGGNVYSFQWSPDGSRLAYRTIKEITLGLFTALLNGSERHKLLVEFPSWFFFWLPDSTRLIYGALDTVNGYKVDLNLVTFDGTNSKNLSGPMNTGGGAIRSIWVD